MGNLFRAFFFKIRKDLAFRITLFIGLGFAILMPTIFFLIDVLLSFIDGSGGEISHVLCTGQSMLVTSFSPTQNFGLAIPINLITFTVLEFTNGTIRNKIVSGYSKVKVFVGLYLTGLIYTFIFISGYVLICFGLGSAFGGFDPNGTLFSLTSLGGTNITPDFLWKFIVIALLAYTSISSMTIFFSSLFRHIGPSIPVVIVLLLICTGMSSIASALNMFSMLGEGEEPTVQMQIMQNIYYFLKAINPLHSLTVYDVEGANVALSWSSFTTAVVNNLIYSGAFFGFGLLIFVKRDIK